MGCLILFSGDDLTVLLALCTITLVDIGKFKFALLLVVEIASLCSNYLLAQAPRAKLLSSFEMTPLNTYSLPLQ
jgi:hypothetical protein